MSRLVSFRRTRWRPLVLLLLGTLAFLCPSAPALATGEFHPSADLRTLETPHFRIIFDSAEGAAAAPRISALLEEIRVQVLDVLQLPDPGFYDVLIIDNYDYANGSAWGFPIRTIRLYLNGPLPPTTGSSDLADSLGDTWLRELITHEYAHAVQLNYFTGWTRWYRNLFWASPFGIIYPSWFVEGLAVAVETEQSTRGRARTSTSDMILRMAALNQSLLAPGLWTGPTAWPRGGARYLYGGSFLFWVHQKYGRGSLQKVLRAANDEIPWLDDLRPGVLAVIAEELGLSPTPPHSWRFGGLERAFKRALGTPLSELIREWALEVTRTAFDDQKIVLEAGQTQTRALAFHTGSTRSPAISPDGAYVAFVGGDDNELRGLYVAPIRGGRSELLLTRDDIVGDIAFSPDGERLVYARIPEQDGPFERNIARSDLYAFELRSRTERRLTYGARLRDPVYSPDGSYLLAVQTGRGSTRLVRLDPDGSLAVELFSPPESVMLAQPKFSPDGRRVVLSVCVQQEPPGRAGYHLGFYALESGVFKLMKGQYTDREAVWLDDERVLFSSDRSGVFNLYTARIGDGQVAAVTNMLGGAFQPRAWREQDGTTGVVLRSYTERGFQIVRLSANRTEHSVLNGTMVSRAVGQLRAAPTGQDVDAAPLFPLQTLEEAGYGAGADVTPSEQGPLANQDAERGQVGAITALADEVTASALAMREVLPPKEEPSPAAAAAPGSDIAAPVGERPVEPPSASVPAMDVPADGARGDGSQLPSASTAAGATGEAAAPASVEQSTFESPAVSARPSSSPGSEGKAVSAKSEDDLELDAPNSHERERSGEPRSAPETPIGQRYVPLSGLRLTGITPELQTDEGSAAAGYVGGTTLGLSAYWMDPIQRHGLYLAAQQGVSSGHPSWMGLYENERLGLPMAFWAAEDAYGVDVLVTDNQGYRVWERSRGSGFSASLPWTRGRLSASLSWDVSAELYERFYALDSALEQGFRTRHGGAARLSIASATSWRSPAQGHFFSLTAYRTDTWRSSLSAGDPAMEFQAGWTGRRHIANGTFDLSVRGGARLDQLDPLRAWGGAGNFLVPGLSYRESVDGFFLGVGRLEFSQDLWRPEWAFGNLPSLSFERLELVGAAGVGLGLRRDGTWNKSGAGLSLGLRGHLATLRNVISLTPQLVWGYNPATQEVTATFTVEGLSMSGFAGARGAGAGAHGPSRPVLRGVPDWLAERRSGTGVRLPSGSPVQERADVDGGDLH